MLVLVPQILRMRPMFELGMQNYDCIVGVLNSCTAQDVLGAALQHCSTAAAADLQKWDSCSIAAARVGT
jgi:hypothetical protein